MRVELPRAQDWRPADVQKQIDRGLGRLVEEAFAVQALLHQKKSDQALERVTKLQTEYPHVAYLGFLRASCLVLKGDRDGAVQSLKAALSIHPDQEDAQRLLESLGGQATKGDSVP